MASESAAVGESVVGEALHQIDAADCKLSPLETKLVSKLTAGADVEIDVLFEAAYGDSDVSDPRVRHQFVGGIISRANRKLVQSGWWIAPGMQRRTYRMFRA